MAVVLTSATNDKLLGIPIIPNGSGEAIAEAVVNLLNKWKIVDLTEMVCFDTTASNTGRFTGAVVRLEELLGHSLLQFPCRRHVSELMLRAAFELFLGKSGGPEVTMFDRFAKKWKNIDATKYGSGMNDEIVLKNISAEECEDLKVFCHENLREKQPRGDYKELLELALVFLGESAHIFHPPSATSHARFMSKGIYSLKMFAFRQQFELTIIELDGLRRLCIFLVRIYIY